MTFQNGLNFYSLRVGEQKPFREAMNSLYLTTINSSKKFQKVSPEDEQSILFETSRPNQLFSEPTLTLRDLHMVVPASLPFIYSFFLFSGSVGSEVSRCGLPFRTVYSARLQENPEYRFVFDAYVRIH